MDAVLPTQGFGRVAGVSVEGRVDFVGDDFREEESEDPQECCRMCEDDLDCFSWTRDRSTGRCFLKTGVPERVENDGTDGGTIF